MKLAALILAGLVLASCDTSPLDPTPPARQAEFIDLVEGSGCRVDPVDHEWLHTAGFTDEELSAIGGDLVVSGVAEMSPEGALVLLTENCI
jgi:hypothetical protein